MINLDSEELDLILAGSPEELKGNIPLLLGIAQIVKFYVSQAQALGEKEFVPKRINKPKVRLFFSQNPRDIFNTPEQPLLTGEISFRLMHESPASLTEGKLKALAHTISSKFAKPPFQWKRGKSMLSYTDWENGLQLQILCPNKTEGKKVVEQILDLINLSPDWEYANFIENLQPTKRYPKKNKKTTVLGEVIKIPQARREGIVVFRYAEIFIKGLRYPITLVDRTGKKTDPLIRDQ